MEIDEDQRQIALDAIALVRLCLKDPSEDETLATLKVIIGDKDQIDLALLIYRLADLAASFIESWRESLLQIIPPDEEMEEAEKLLDRMVEQIIGVPDDPEGT